jgi:hypothetical protein
VAGGRIHGSGGWIWEVGGRGRMEGSWVRPGGMCWRARRLGLLPPLPWPPSPPRHFPSPLPLPCSACCWLASAGSGGGHPLWRASSGSSSRLVGGWGCSSSFLRAMVMPFRSSPWLSVTYLCDGSGGRHAATRAARTLVVCVVVSGVGGDSRVRHWRLPS